MAIASPALRPRALGELVAIGLAAAFVVACFATGQYLVALAVAGLGALAAVTYRWPAPGIALVIFLSTDGMKFFSLEKLPYLQLGPGLRLNAGDIMLLVLLGVGVAHLARRRERPLFATPLLVLGTAVMISMGVGLVSGTIDVGLGFNGLRVFSGLLFYVALVGLVDTPAKLRSVIRVVFLLVVVSVVVQVVEAGLGERIATPLSSTSEYFSSTKFVSNVEGTVPYLWNRAVGYLFVGFFLSLGAWLWSKRIGYGVVALVGLTGFVVALVRQWYVFLVIGVLVLLMVGSRNRSGALMRVALASMLMLALVMSASNWLPSGFPLAEALQDRTGSILNFSSDYSVLARVEVWQGQIATFMESPIVGLGPGTAETLFSSMTSGWSTDIGMTNSLVQFGVLGLAAIAFLGASVYRKARALITAMPASSGREYAAAAFSLWVAILIAYTFTQDFFTSTELCFATGLVMTIIDRLYAFSSGAPRLRG
ncbi:MAG: hypothetical protein M3323_11095 [Actinomycetota bacterium]|nr:hypothetical protein [Actinomycetota bacterium]